MSGSVGAAAEIRAALDHPVVDADGHIIEYWPELHRYLEEEGIPGGLGTLLQSATFDGSRSIDYLRPEERMTERSPRTPWWGFPNDARDLATATVPRLLHERLDELGIDFAVCYPSVGLQLPAQLDTNLRRRGCRAYNRYAARQFRGLADRLAPVAVIPTVDPDEAIDELEFCVQELGFRAAVFGGFAVRRFEGSDDRAFWIDALGLDSVHDYDPLWHRSIELGIAPTFHSGSMGWSGRRSISNFSYNHMGNFAAAGETTAKSMFFGGVFRRFPQLRCAYLEGGVGWAVQMLTGLIEHYEKRGPEGLTDRDPGRIDAALFDRLVEEYADGITPIDGWGERMKSALDNGVYANDFEAAGVESDADIVTQITTNMFFGCEADDPSTAAAFDAERNPGGAVLRPVFSSDIGHWDVAHMADVVPEAHEHRERGLLDPDQFRAFVCDNAVRLYTDANPAFFDGTVMEDYVGG